MIIKHGDQKTTVNENMRGGNGKVVLKQLISQPEMYEKGRLFSRILLQPGCSIGFHVHENEMEAYYVVKGKALYDDNGTKVELEAGDGTYTPCGGGHAVENNGSEDLELIALILFK